MGLINLGLGLQGGLGENTSWQNGSGASNGYNWSQGNSLSENYGDSWNSAVQNAYNRVYGTEAGKVDISNAKEANQEARDMWAMQADYNAREAQINRDYQTAMSNSAYQRAVKDLQSAGLNPILAVGGGMQASSPMGATAVAGLSSAHKAQAFADSVGQSSGSSSGGSHNRGWSQGQNSAYGENSSFWNTAGGSYGWTGNNVAEAAKTLGEMVKGSFEAFENYAKENADNPFDDWFGMTPHSTANGFGSDSGRGRQTYTAPQIVKQTVSTAKTLANTLNKTTNKSFVSNTVKSAQKKKK